MPWGGTKYEAVSTTATDRRHGNDNMSVRDSRRIYKTPTLFRAGTDATNSSTPTELPWRPGPWNYDETGKKEHLVSDMSANLHPCQSVYALGRCDLLVREAFISSRGLVV